MSVIAMTMDDQRPLLNAYNQMQEQKYEQNVVNSANAPPSGPASPTPSGSEEPMPQQYHHLTQYHHHQLGSTTAPTTTHHNHHHHVKQQQYQHHHQHHHHHHHRHQTTSPQRADANVVIEQKQQQLQQQHQQPAQQTITETTATAHQHVKAGEQIQAPTHSCAVTVKAESVVDANGGQHLLEEEIKLLKEEQSRLLQQCADAQRREKILMRRLANKEQEFQDYVNQIAEYKAAQAPSAIALRSALLDPAVNLLFLKLKKELKTTKAKLEETQNELSAWKFTPDSNTGKRLMAKCRLLYQENEELGKMTSNGRLAKLETELSMQKSFSKLLIKSQSELDEFLQELDEDVEGMQSTILLLQQELKTKNERIQILDKENEQLREANIKNSSTDCKEALDLVTSETVNGETKTPKIEVVEKETKTALAVYQEETAAAAAAAAAAQLDLNNSAESASIAIKDMSQIKQETECNEITRSGITEHTPYYNGVAENLSSTITANEEIVLNPRKRALESSPLYENKIHTTPQPSYMSTPRTLPPKKSKLRVTPEEINEQVEPFVANMQVAEEALSLVMEKDHTHNDMLAAGCEDLSDNSSGGIGGIGMAAQRILTRRRTMRQQTQPNGSINMSSNGGENGSEAADLN